MEWFIEADMGAVVTFFLRAKHWQVFLLFFGIGYVAGPAAMFLPLVISRSPEELLKNTLPFGVVMLLFTLCFVAWLWAMGTFLNSISVPSLRLPVRFFRCALLYPTVYIVLFVATFGATKPAVLALIVPLHLFAMACLFYDLYFVSKSLALVETGKQVSFPDYAGTFFLLWFFLVGVWFIQPKINRLFTQPFSSTKTMSAAEPVGSTTEIQSATDFAYAGFWLRLCAALVDGLVIFVPLTFLLVWAIFVVKLVSAEKGYEPAIGIFVALVAATLLVPWLYFSFLESSHWQATIGKSLLRLYVVDLEGHRITRSRAMGRNLAKYLSNVTIGIGYVMCGVTKKKRALHDIIAGSLVLRRQRFR